MAGARFRGFNPDTGPFQVAAQLTARGDGTGALFSGLARGVEGAIIQRDRKEAREMAREERAADRAESARRFDVTQARMRDEAAMRQGRMALDILGQRRGDAMTLFQQIRADFESGAVDPNDPAAQQRFRQAAEGVNRAEQALGAKAREVAGVDVASGQVVDPDAWRMFQQDVDAQVQREQDPAYALDLMGQAKVLEGEISTLRSQMRGARRGRRGQLERAIVAKTNELAGIQSEVRRMGEAATARKAKLEQFEGMRERAKQQNALTSYADSLLAASDLDEETKLRIRGTLHRQAQLPGAKDTDIRATFKTLLPKDKGDEPLSPKQEEAKARRKGELQGITEDAKKDRLDAEGRGPKPEKPKPVSTVSPDAAAMGIRQAMERDGVESIESVIANRGAEELIAASLSMRLPADQREAAFQAGVERMLGDGEDTSRGDRINKFNSAWGALPAEARTRTFAVKLKEALGL